MKFATLLAAAALSCAAISYAAEPLKNEGIRDYAPSSENLHSRKAFRDARLGIFIHWGVYSMLADGECVMAEKGIPYSAYSLLPGGFYPAGFDAAQWVSAIKNSGAKYITFTARHVDGFAMFKSEVSAYNIMDATPFGRDVVKELADECHKQGIVLNFYYSLADWGREDYPVGVMGRECGKDPSKADFDHYIDFICAQLTELLSNYGPIGCIWLDCDWDHIAKPAPGEKVVVDFDWHYDRIYSLIHELQPSCLIGNNHHRESIPGEDIQIFERDVPGENTAGFSRTTAISELPLETCQTMNRSWGYNIKDNDFKSSTELIRLLVRTAGRDANLLLNLGPQPDGRIPAASLERLEEVGKWLSQYGGSIYGTRATVLKPQDWGVLTAKGDRWFVHVMDKPSSGTIRLPLQAKVRKAQVFGTNERIRYSTDDSGIAIELPESADCSTDFIVEIVHK